MGADKPSEGALPEDMKCPNCGAWESQGGCENPSACARALAQREADYSRKITKLLAQESERPLQLLMAGLEALNLLNVGLAVTTRSGQLLMANRKFEQILAAHDGLELTSDGVLQMQERSTAVIGELMQRAQVNAAAGKSRHAAAFAVARPSGRRPLTMYIRSSKSAAASGDAAGPSAVVFVMDPELSVETAETELRQLYGLTQTEARVANLLMEGKTLDECCQQLAIRRSTGRTHVQHLFEKVGVQRQSELVSVLWKSIGLIRTRGNKEEEGTNSSVLRSTGLNQTLFRMFVNRTFPKLDDFDE
jgi:DNA-binding CsgD family transcriptional regulator